MQERKNEWETMPTFACRPSTMRSSSFVDSPQSSMVGQQRQQISELQFDKYLITSSFLCWQIRFKTQVSACFCSLSKAMLWIEEVEMVDSVDEKIAINCGQEFPQF